MVYPTLYQIFGDNPFDAGRKLMESSLVWKEWNESDRIALKPNLVVSKEASSGATTHPEFCEGIIDFLFSRGFNDLYIIEGSWVGDRTEIAFRRCGYEKLSRKYNIPLIDLQKDEWDDVDLDGRTYKICHTLSEMDRLINLPVIKGHCQTRMTCAMKNLKGCIPDSEKRRFHRDGLHRPIADLNRIIKADLILADGMNGDPDFEEGGNPLAMNLFLGGTDPVLMDSYVCSLLGLELSEVPYIEMAHQDGVGELVGEETRVISLNKGEGIPSIQRSPGAALLAGNIREDGACSACYASLIRALKELQNEGVTPDGPLNIGQGFRGKSPVGIGIGRCLSSGHSFIGGCPPDWRNIKRFLEGEGNE